MVYGLDFLCALPSVFQVQLYNSKLREPDLRQVASAWIRDELPDRTRLAMNWFPYCPRVKVRQQNASQYAADPQALQILQEAWVGIPSYEVDNMDIGFKRPVVPEFYRDKIDLADLETHRIFRRGWLSPCQMRQRGVEYVVLPEAAYGRFVYADPSTVTPALTEGAAHYHFAKNRAYFSNLIDPNNPEIEEVVRFESQAGVRGASIAIYRLR